MLLGTIPAMIQASVRQSIVFVWLILALVGPALAGEGPLFWEREFPATDFKKYSIDYSEIRSDSATRDSIPPINKPRFAAVDKINGIGDLEPVISVVIDGEARAYPIRIMLWHEIVNDRIGNVPILVSYCPLCNSSVVYDRRVDGRALAFGNTGRLRHFDMVMYDHATSSWWQQFDGQAIVGEMLGKRLKPIASRVESLARFRSSWPDGQVMVPSDPAARPYGTTPYVRMDSSDGSGLEAYGLPKGVTPFDRVVVVGREAWTLKLLRERGVIEEADTVIAWEAGQNSAHDAKLIYFGRDVGNVMVRRFDPNSDEYIDAPHDLPFAFTFAAFVKGGVLHVR